MRSQRAAPSFKYTTTMTWAIACMVRRAELFIFYLTCDGFLPWAGYLAVTMYARAKGIDEDPYALEWVDYNAEPYPLLRLEAPCPHDWIQNSGSRSWSCWWWSQ